MCFLRPPFDAGCLPVGDGRPTFCRSKIPAEFCGWPLALFPLHFFDPPQFAIIITRAATARRRGQRKANSISGRMTTAVNNVDRKRASAVRLSNSTMAIKSTITLVIIVDLKRHGNCFFGDAALQSSNRQFVPSDAKRAQFWPRSFGFLRKFYSRSGPSNERPYFDGQLRRRLIRPSVLNSMVAATTQSRAI